jgi:hypothetical protein
MQSIDVRKTLRVKSEVSLVVLDARVHYVCPRGSPRRGCVGAPVEGPMSVRKIGYANGYDWATPSECPERIRRIPGFQLWTPATKSSIAVLSPRSLFTMSPSASTLKGFLFPGTELTARLACSNRTARWSRVPVGSTEHRSILDNTRFESRRQFGRRYHLLPCKTGKNCWVNSRDRIRPLLL